jgi:hypothetical protein
LDDGFSSMPMKEVAHRRMIIEAKEYLLRVIYEEAEDKNVVVTTYLTSQIDRYWKENKKNED